MSIRDVTHQALDLLNSSRYNWRQARTLVAFANGESWLSRWFPGQSKYLVMTKNDLLGQEGHYHHYAELYHVVFFPDAGTTGSDPFASLREGEVTFDLWDPGADEKQRQVLKSGDTLIIPPGVVHRGYAKAGTILLAQSSLPYRVGMGDDILKHLDPIGTLPYGL